MDIIHRDPIKHEPGYLPESINKTIAALVDADIGLYQMAGALFRLHHEPNDPNKPVVLVQVTPPYLVDLATRVGVHTKYDARSGKEKVINCPLPVAAGIIARGHYPEFPPLNGITESATLDLTGREISNPGYDKPTGIYVAIDKPLPPWNDVNGRAKIQKAIKKLKRPLRGFPFLTDADRSAVMAAIMTGLLRKLLPSAPMFAITASTAGTGKTLLAEVVAIIATGRRPPVVSLGSDENELAKRIYGILASGATIFLLDNITKPLGNEDVINQILTQICLCFRPLGSSVMMNAPTNLLVLATGNNLALVGDLKRRVVLIALDAKDERPETREFDFDVLAEVMRDRDELIRAALEVTKGYIESGKPKVEGWKPFGSFNEWDMMVRRPLMFAGEPDPIASAEVLREIDPDMEAMRMMFSAIYRLNIHSEYAQLSKPVRASEIIENGLKKEDNAYINPDLHAALEMVCGGRIDNRRLGNWLRQHTNRIVDIDSDGDINQGRTSKGQLIRQKKDRTGAALWEVVKS